MTPSMKDGVFGPVGHTKQELARFHRLTKVYIGDSRRIPHGPVNERVFARGVFQRGDISVFGLVRDPFRRMLFPSPGGVTSSRRAEAQDLSSGTQGFLADVLAAALTLPGVSEARLVQFARDSYWRGETHRLTDRPASIGRLIEEAAAAGAEQMLVVASSAEPPGPHELRPPRLDGLGRVGEQIASAEAAALSDAIRHLHHRFQGVYLIRPAHNPIRPLDLTGAYDEKSDRMHSLEELMERGYEDTYRQFIEPFLGASGDRVAQVARE